MKRLLTFVSLATAVLLAAFAAVAQAKPHGSPGGPATYAVIGDTPYGKPQAANFPNDVGEINADPAVGRVLHLGDIKNGSSRCDTSYFEQIRANFNLFQDPLVYTPGDNEWTDCHRTNNGAYWPAGPVLNGDPRPARLSEVRRIFFDQPGQTMGIDRRAVETQGGSYPENVRWFEAGVEFATLDVPGSNNDWLPWFGTARTSSQLDEVEGRTNADLRWLRKTFLEARRDHAKAVVIGWQANAWDPAFITDPAPAGQPANPDPAQYDHFTSLVQSLAKRSRAFKRPVLLMNGDSHQFIDDTPLADPAHPLNRSIYGIRKPVPNLRRIVLNGSTTPCHEWLKLGIDSNSSDPFSYTRTRFHNQPGFDPTVCPPG